jgi:Asp-tRNA(Asn)/Glu-tRNA(Gln) amidotransferase A subunit family amidase
MNPHELENLTIAELAPELKYRRISPPELTESLLERIRRINPILNAYITVTVEAALEDAERAHAGRLLL